MNESQAILDLLPRNEDEAFRLLFDRYYDNLLLYCYHILNDLAAAEDVVQDSLSGLWKSKRLHAFTGDLDRFIFKIVKNQSFLFLKEKNRRTHLPASMAEDDGEPVPFDSLEKEQQEFELLYNTIDRLSEKNRKVFLMACLNDRTYQEIADELGTSINTVKTQMKAALRFLRENLQKESFSSILVLLTNRNKNYITLFSSFENI